MSGEAGDLLLTGCRQLQVSLSGEQLDHYLRYLALLQKWNQAYNLTAVRDTTSMVTRHLLDSLSIARFVTGASVADVGTGAGLPGIVLAILYPEKRFDLIDSNGKKTRFLFQVKTSLGLENTAIYNERVEGFRPDRAYDQVVSRAFASLSDMVMRCRHLLRPGGELLAMKGARPDDEIATIERVCNVAAVDAVTVPGLKERRHVVRLTLT